MQKPDDIPEDVWEAALGVTGDFVNYRSQKTWFIFCCRIARAILAERERREAEWATKLMHAEAKAILSDRDEAGQRCSASLTSEQDPQNPNRRVLFAVKSPGNEDDERT